MLIAILIFNMLRYFYKMSLILRLKRVWFMLRHGRDYFDIFKCELGLHCWQDLALSRDLYAFKRVQKCRICLQIRVWWDDRQGWKMHTLPGSERLEKEDFI